jgi:hypothetical protein
MTANNTQEIQTRNSQILKIMNISTELNEIPEPMVIGNSQIEILGHNIISKKNEKGINTSIKINLKNITCANIGKATFAAIFTPHKEIL